MSIPELKSRIRSIDTIATSTHGDAVRAWWACTWTDGEPAVEHDPQLLGIDAGIARANALADEGVGAVVLSTTTPVHDDVRAIVGLLCAGDATDVSPLIANDFEWMQTCARIRDAQSNFRPRIADALELVDPDFAGLVGLLLGLAARATPGVLIGTAAHAAAILGQRQSIAAAGWWRSGLCSSDPLESIACKRLQFEPWWSGRTVVSPDVVEALVIGTISSLRSSQ